MAGTPAAVLDHEANLGLGVSCSKAKEEGACVPRACSTEPPWAAHLKKRMIFFEDTVILVFFLILRAYLNTNIFFINKYI